MSALEYRESLRSYAPRVFVDGDRIEAVADEPRLAPGINAIVTSAPYVHELLVLPGRAMSANSAEPAS
jgi:4-hydroxybutyryl-CoA dehydratase / vinylacetyl-CoA-Delta-isomerase